MSLKASRMRVGVLLLALVLAAGPAGAQQTFLSPDVTLGFGATVVADEDVAIAGIGRSYLLDALGPLPERVDVVAFGLEDDGDRLMAFGTTVELQGGVVARRGDVVRYDGAAYSIAFDADAAGIPAGVAVDAVHAEGNNLVLSFDTTVALGPAPLVAADEDLVLWKAQTFLPLFDGSAEGVHSSLDVDAGQHLGGGVFYLSFDSTGEVGGLVVEDEDIVLFDGSTWSLAYDASLADPAWERADLDALYVPEPAAFISLSCGALLLGALARRRERGGRVRM